MTSPAGRCLQTRPLAAIGVVTITLFAAITAALGLGSRINNPIRLDVEFPRTATASSEPLVVTGHPSHQMTLLCARVLGDGSVELRYIVNAATSVAQPVKVAPGRHRLELRLPPLDAPRRVSRPAAIHHDRAIATLDGRRVLDVRMAHANARIAPRTIHVGTNPLPDTPCGPRFSGTVVARPAFVGGWTGFTQGYVSVARRFPELLVACFVLSLAIAVWLGARAQPDPAAFVAGIAQRVGVPLAAGMLPLLEHIDLTHSFDPDWLNHIWIIAYHGTHLARWHVPPDVLHTAEAVGMLHPVFYGHVFYTLLGIPSMVLGPDVGFRLGAFATLLLQFHECRGAVGLVASRFTANTIALLVCWTIYPLTNLYIRGAIPEFFAVCLLTCALCCLLRAPLLASARARDAALLRFTLYFGVAALTHPITFVIGSMLVAIVLVPVLIAPFGGLRDARRAAFAGRLALAGVLLAGMLSPWLYVVLRFGAELEIAGTHGIRRIVGVDNTWVRLFPLPVDPRAIATGMIDVDTAYLNAQINTPLLIVGIALAGASAAAAAARRSQRDPVGARPLEGPWHRYGTWLWVCGILTALIALSVSVSAPIARMATPVVGIIQWAYRLANYVNLALLVFVFGRLLVTRREGPLLTYACVCALTLAGAGVLLEHMQARPRLVVRSAWRSELEMVRLPGQYYFAGDYTVRAGRIDTAGFDPALPMHARLTPLPGGRFGQVPPVRIHLTAPSAVQTNVLASRWNRVIVDGVAVDPKAMTNVNFRLRIDLGPGSHEIAYRFEPDAAWRVLRVLSWMLLIGAGGTCVRLAARTRSADGTIHDEGATARADRASSARGPHIR